MKTLITLLLACVYISANAQTYTLNWGSSFAGNWPTNATSRNAFNIGGSGVDCAASVTKSGGVFTTVYGSYGGPPTPTVTSSTFIVPGSSNNLQLSLDFSSATQYCEVVFNFSQPVFNVKFNLADIDRLGNTYNNYFDKITVTGYIGTLSGGATITKYDSVSDPNFMFVSGNTAYVNTANGASGNAASDATDQKGTVGVRFDGFYITSFRIRYENTAGVLANPTVQNIAIGNISFNKSVPLPVNLQSFSGSLNSMGLARLDWTTSMETEFDYYSIEKSQDGKIFEETGMIPSYGNATSYHFTDPSGIDSKIYYRLKMINADGSFAYSKTILLNGSRVKSFKAYPMIASNNITVAFPSDTRKLVRVDIWNCSGQSVHQYELVADRGQNHFILTLPGGLATGPYFIGLQHSGDAVRIIKQ